MIVVAKIKAKSGQEDDMEKAMKEIIPEVEKEEGTLMYALHRAQNDPTVFLFYEKYKDVEALAFHSSTPHFKDLFGKIAPFLDGKPEIDMYDEVAGFSK